MNNKKRISAALTLILVAVPIAVFAAITLTSPPSAAAGSEIEVAWSGDASGKNLVTIVEKGTPEGKYKDYKYARSAKVTLAVPEKPGEYEVRFLDHQAPYATLARQPLVIEPVTATVDAPEEVKAGAEFPVNWSGPANRQDFISLAPPGGEKRNYLSYEYTRKGSPLTMRVPDAPGAYEIRYQTGRELTILAAQSITVSATTASLDAPDTVEAGAKIEVTWSGPDNRQDFVSLSPAGGEDRDYLTYQYTRTGSPLSLRAPDAPGEYEIRYQTGQAYVILATRKVVVSSTTAAIDAPTQVEAGSEFEASWTGPDNAQDYVSLAAAGADQRSYVTYRYTRNRARLKFRAPDEPGKYELRYQTGQSYTVLAAHSLAVTPVNASVSGPAEVEGGVVIEVEWSGPDNPGDYIGIVSSDAEQDEHHASWGYTREGSPLSIRAPLIAGEYLVRYETGQKGLILATAPLVVTPSTLEPGSLRVVSESALFALEDGVEIILDASGSMLQRQGDRRRIEIAREVLLGLTGEIIPPRTAFALRVFGHREADSCRTDLEVPIGPLDVGAVESKIAGIQAMNLAKTPIAASLALVKEDMSQVSGKRTIVLITDGEETCGGDPAATIQALRDSGIDLRIEIVGFAIDDEALKTSFRYWADLGGGSFHDAADAESLATSITQALHAPFDVYDADKTIVASGTIGGDAVDLAPGKYSVRVRGKGVESPVHIEPEKEQILAIN